MIRVSNILFWFGLVIAASLALYHTSDRVHALHAQLRTLDSAIVDQRQDIHVLQADWVYLSNPERVEKEARQLPLLRPTAPAQVVAMQNLDAALPSRASLAEAQAGQAPGDLRGSVEVAHAKAPGTLPRRAAALRPKIVASAKERFHIPIVIERSAPESGRHGFRTIGSLIAELGSQP